jgi:hypothetical protein
MSTLQVCKHCGKPLPSNRKSYCSPECLAEGLKKPPIKCIVCGIEFKPIRKSSQYCSLGCFNKARIKQARSTPEPDPVPGARWIPLSQNKFALVDEADYADVSRFTWCAVKVRPNQRGEVFYAKRTDTPIYMHIYILQPPRGMEVDHIGDSLDNRRSQLRAVDHSKNQMNRYANAGTSKYKGVSKSKYSNKWAARVDAAGRIHHLGYFDDEIDAAKAYDTAARVYQVSHARLNFPGPDERSAIREPS